MDNFKENYMTEHIKEVLGCGQPVDNLCKPVDNFPEECEQLELFTSYPQVIHNLHENRRCSGNMLQYKEL